MGITCSKGNSDQTRWKYSSPWQHHTWHQPATLDCKRSETGSEKFPRNLPSIPALPGAGGHMQELQMFCAT